MLDRTSRKVLFLVTMLLLISSASVLVWQDRAWGESGAGGAGSAGLAEEVVMTPFLVAPGHDGIAVLDRVSRTICLYQFQPSRPAHERFVLLAARHIGYDLQLADYNTAEPRPEQVKALLEQSGGSAAGAGKGLEAAPAVRRSAP